MGNVCVTFFRDKHDPDSNMKILANALKKFGLETTVEGQHSMFLNGLKVFIMLVTHVRYLVVHIGSN